MTLSALLLIEAVKDSASSDMTSLTMLNCGKTSDWVGDRVYERRDPVKSCDSVSLCKY